MSSTPAEQHPLFHNLHDQQVYGSDPLPATWDDGDSGAVVSYWWDQPDGPDGEIVVGIGVALYDGSGVMSVGCTPTEARKIAERILAAVEAVEPTEE